MDCECVTRFQQTTNSKRAIMDCLFSAVAQIQVRHSNTPHHLIWNFYFVSLDSVVYQVKC